MSNLKGGRGRERERFDMESYSHTCLSPLASVQEARAGCSPHSPASGIREWIQAAFARYLHKAESHAELDISENFNPVTLPTISFAEVDNSPKPVAENRSPLLEPYYSTLSIAEMSLMMDNVGLDDPPLDEADFLGCRYFVRFVAEAVDRGSRVIVMQDEKQTIAVMVHVKALWKLRGDRGTALLQYNCVPRTDRYKIESMVILTELLKDAQAASILGTEHQIHCVAQVLQAHERLLDKSVISKHHEEWYLRQKCICPSVIVPLSPITADSEFSTLQELKVDATPASERAPSDANEPVLHSCADCYRKSTKLKICSVCKSVKYCSRDCQDSDWPSHKKSCKAAEPPKKSKPLPSGAHLTSFYSTN